MQTRDTKGPRFFNFSPPLFYLSTLVLALVYGAIVFDIGLSEFDINEHYYAIGLSLLLKGKEVYTDFPFVQTPYLILIYEPIFKFLNINTEIILYGKIASFITSIANLILVVLIARQITRNLAIAFFTGVLFAASENLLRISWEFANYNLHLFFLLLINWFFIRAGTSRRQGKYFFLSGICWGLATGVKLYMAPAVLVLLFGIWFYFPVNKKRYMLWFVSGAFLALLPLLAIVVSDPKNFWFQNVKWHVLFADNSATLNEYYSVFWRRAAYFVGNHITHVDNIMMLIPGFFALNIWINNSRHNWIQAFKNAGIGSYLLLATPFAHSVILLTLPFIYAQYLPMFTAWMVLIPAFSYRLLGRLDRRRLRQLMAITCTIAGFLFIGKHFDRIVSPAKAYTEFPRPHLQIQQYAGEGAQVATMLPGFVADGNFNSYVQLATGNLNPRVLKKLTFAELGLANLATPEGFYGILNTNPPDAILVGWNFLDKDREEVLINFAKNNRYVPKKIIGYEKDTLTLYVNKLRALRLRP